MQCPTCHATVPDGARFCNVCGAAIPQQMACAECGQPVKPGQKFCMSCGAPVTTAPVRPEPAKIVPAASAPAQAPPGRRGRWWLLAIPLVLVAAAIVAAIALDLPDRLAQRPTPQSTLTSGGAVTPGPAEGAAVTPGSQAPTEAPANPEALWAQAQQRQAAGAWEDTLALLTQLRAADASFQPAEVSSLLVAACTNLACQAEQAPDPAAASAHWACVLQERASDAEAAAGKQRADLYLRGGTALEAKQYPQAIAAWDELQRTSASYADVADRLYLAYIAYGDALCATRTPGDIQEGRKQYGLARALAPARPEAIEKLRACQPPTSTPPPTATPLPGPHLGVIVDAEDLRVRSGPGAGHLVLGKLTTGDAVTITGRTADATWVQVEAGAERQGWVSSQYVKANYPTEAALVVPVPPLLKRVGVAEARTDFAPQQGFRDWFYLISTAPGSLKFTRMPWDGDQWYRWCCDGNYNPKMRISNAGGYPSQSYDVARLWVSPYEGQLRITGAAHKESGAGRGGNGVLARIIQNKDTIWEYPLGSYDTTGTTFDLTVTSKSGDEFYFIVNALGDDAADNTVFDPTIELLHPEGVDMPAPERWAETAQEAATAAPTPTPTRPLAAALCFEPRLRHYEEHKGCCAEVAGLVYNRQGQPFGPRGAVLHIEGPPATDRYVRDFGVDAGGGYSVTALSVDKYTIWLKGPNIRSKQYAVQYDDWAKIRIIVDFYQVACW
ncbi:MAG: hypothetical protein CVU38_06580 [Chloroflexi bacterium HGW-Chloroflexi-1]|nr:MAG: hypothetical protein CVU38_06580 [Chloroflexi bacterium HGW-Chloroflexi-1]